MEIPGATVWFLKQNDAVHQKSLLSLKLTTMWTRDAPEDTETTVEFIQ